VGSVLKISDLLDAFGKIEEADFDFNFKLGLPENAFVEDYVSLYGDFHILESGISTSTSPLFLLSLSNSCTMSGTSTINFEHRSLVRSFANGKPTHCTM
jgi:hypothetical protein